MVNFVLSSFHNIMVFIAIFISIFYAGYSFANINITGQDNFKVNSKLEYSTNKKLLYLPTSQPTNLFVAPSVPEDVYSSKKYLGTSPFISNLLYYII